MQQTFAYLALTNVVAAIAILRYDWKVGLGIAAALLAATFMLWLELARRSRSRREITAANIELRERLEALQERSRELTMLTDMSELLQLSTTLEEAYEILPVFATQLFPSCDGALYVARATDRHLELGVVWGAAPRASSFRPADCWALRRAHAHVSGDVAGGVACAHANDDDSVTALCIPMLASGEAIGVLMLRSRAGTVDPDLELFAKAFGDQIALALANLRLQETLRTRAVRDPLTGLFNRGYMQDVLTRELLGSSRENVRTGVILVDVDNFKRYNDTWGHPGGDALLQQLARMMQRVVGDADIVCRYGGEEFVVIVPSATFELLQTMGERLRDESRQLHIRSATGALLGTTTLSAGIALSPRHGLTVDELIAAADRALYTAKSGGRDQIAFPPQPVLDFTAA